MALSNRRIRAYNRACTRRDCHNECEGIGWCEAVYAEVCERTNAQIRLVAAIVFVAGIAAIGFLVGLGIYKLWSWLF